VLPLRILWESSERRRTLSQHGAAEVIRERVGNHASTGPQLQPRNATDVGSRLFRKKEQEMNKEARKEMSIEEWEIIGEFLEFLAGHIANYKEKPEVEAIIRKLFPNGVPHRVAKF
jgi:hypothetical protein